MATCHIQVYSKQKTLVIETSETEVSKKIYEFFREEISIEMIKNFISSGIPEGKTHYSTDQFDLEFNCKHCSIKLNFLYEEEEDDFCHQKKNLAEESRLYKNRR